MRCSCASLRGGGKGYKFLQLSMIGTERDRSIMGRTAREKKEDTSAKLTAWREKNRETAATGTAGRGATGKKSSNWAKRNQTTIATRTCPDVEKRALRGGEKTFRREVKEG